MANEEEEEKETTATMTRSTGGDDGDGQRQQSSLRLDGNDGQRYDDDDDDDEGPPPPVAHHHQNTEPQQQERTPQQTQQQTQQMVFVHLDWGIGGAEQLMLQLVHAAVHGQQNVELVTTKCDPDHCFDELKLNRPLRQKLHIWGKWIPTTIFGGYGQAFLSTIRLIYLAICVVHAFPNADWIITDVLPTSLWVFRYFMDDVRIFFYCHFPDRLLIRQQPAAQKPEGIRVFLRNHLYRTFVDGLEEKCMTMADVIAVNSQYTKTVVQQTFPKLLQQNHDLPVLYPAFVEDNNDNNDNDRGDNSSSPGRRDENKNMEDEQHHHRPKKKDPHLFVSLNRYERKKKLELLIEAAAWVVQNHQQDQQQQHQPDDDADADAGGDNCLLHVIIAGGYDKGNVENVEYRGELGILARRYTCSSNNLLRITFRQSITDTERTHLLQKAAAVVYTPSNEHFGIVPLEAMFHGTPVLACRSGGPMETIIHGETGYLCEPTPESFGRSMIRILQNPESAVTMGKKGHEHVITKFSLERLRQEFVDILERHNNNDHHRRQRRKNGGGLYYRVLPRQRRTLLWLLDAFCSLIICLFLTFLLRALWPSSAYYSSAIE